MRTKLYIIILLYYKKNKLSCFLQAFDYCILHYVCANSRGDGVRLTEVHLNKEKKVKLFNLAARLLLSLDQQMSTISFFENFINDWQDTSIATRQK